MVEARGRLRIDPLRPDRRRDLLAVFRHRRQGHALPPLGRDRAQEKHGAGDRRGGAGHRHRHDRRGGGAWVSEPPAIPAAEPPTGAIRPVEVALLASVFIVAACGLVYELAAGTLASYLLGDSILQFSTVIGTYLFAMGVGSWLSRFLERQLVAQFLRVELLVGLVGGLTPATLFALQSASTPSPPPTLRA